MHGIMDSHQISDAFMKPPNFYGTVKTGTTIVALCYDKGVIVGSDGRTSMGAMVADRCARKINYISDRIALLSAGSAADNQILARLVKNYIDQFSIELGERPQVYTAAHIFHSIMYQNKDYLQSSLIVGGWDKQKGPQIYAVPSGGSLIQRDKYYCAGSGSTFLTGFLDHSFKYGLTYEEARELMVKAISQSVKRDNSSGGGIRLTNICAEEMKEDYIGYNDIEHYDHKK